MLTINNLTREYDVLSEQIETAVLSVIRSGRWLQGSAIERFSHVYSKYLDVSYVVPVANGTDALEIALRSVGVGAGDRVITVANAGCYTTTACRLIGAEPVYIDVREIDLTLDPDRLADALSSQVRAVVVTHLYGNLADVQGVRDKLHAAGRSDVIIIEDCAQAHGARNNGKVAGSFGDLATFSFYPSKNLGALGDAGAVVTNREDLARMLSLLHQYGWDSRYHSVVSFGRNSRMDEIQAAVLEVKLGYLDEMNKARRSILQAYRKALPFGYRFCALEGEQSVVHLAVLDCPDRDAAQLHLTASGIQTDIHYPILDCDQASMQGLPMQVGDLSRSRSATKRILTIPCFPSMTSSEIDMVCSKLRTLPSGGSS